MLQDLLARQRAQLAPTGNALGTPAPNQLLANVQQQTALPPIPSFGPAVDPNVAKADAFIREMQAKAAGLTGQERIAADQWIQGLQQQADALRYGIPAAADPTLAAFLRSMGIAENQAWQNANAEALFVRNAYDRQVPVFQEQMRAAEQGITDDAETRGVLASGATATNVATARGNILRQQQIAQGEAGDQYARIQLDAVNKIADIQRQRAEAEMEARLRQSQNLAKNTYGAA